MPAQRATLTATSLKLDPGTGLAGPREPFARRLGAAGEESHHCVQQGP